MPINFGLAQPASDPLDTLRYFGQGQQDAAARQQLAIQQQQRQQQLAARPQITQRVQSGDYEGARQAAVAVGDNEYATAIAGLSEEHRKRLADETEFLGRTANGILQLPPEQWQAAYQQAIPEAKRLGFSDAEIAAFQPTRENLMMAVQHATSLKDSLDAQAKLNEPYTLNQGEHRFVGGRDIASVAPKPEYITTPAGGTSTLVNGDSVAPQAPGTISPPVSGDGLVARMLPITLGSEGGGTLANPNTSPKGAKGPMQVLDSTNGNPGYGVRPAQDDSQEERARVGRDYLGAMVQKYEDPAKAWAAYNAGPGAVDAALASRGNSWLQALPRETRRYVARNLAQLQQSGPTGSSVQVARGGPPAVIHGGPAPVPAPAGYRWQGGNLEAIPGGPADPGNSEMTSAAIDNAARVYNMTGQIPPSLGRGGRVQQQILSRAAELQGGTDTGTVVADRAGRKADTAALVALQRQASQVFAFEDTAKRNGVLALNLSRQVANGNVPIFNAWVNAGRKATGDPKVAAFNAATESFATEYAKVVSGATGGAVTSDSAREHARQIISTALSPQQYASVISTLFADMENRRKGLDNQRSELITRISGPQQKAAQAAPVQVRTPEEADKLPHGTVFIDPHGRRKVRP